MNKMNPVDQYFQNLPEDRKNAMQKLRAVINENIPAGVEETMNYGMPAWVIPKHIYPAGYHCDPKLPLPFLNIASQKSHMAFYHMGLYASADLMDWFLKNWEETGMKKPDMGKSCIRFKKEQDIPFELLAALCKKMDSQTWISLYEKALKKQG